MKTFREAFALSAAEVDERTPPGTVRILNQQEDSASSVDGHLLKFPKPSNSPRDPLNLPLWRKIAALLVASVYAFVSNYISSSIAPVLQLWFSAYPQEPKPFSELSYIIAINLLCLGGSNIWWVPLSSWMGRRPVLLIATLLMTLCSVWCAEAKSFASLLAARALQGAGGGAAETVAPALIGDLFFIHQRGRAMAVYTIFLSAGSLFGGLTGGYLGYSHGWTSIWWVSTALCAFVFVGVALFVPETLFDRPAATDNASTSSVEGKEPTTKELETVQVQSQTTGTGHESFTFLQSLQVGLGKHAHARGSLASYFLRPWKTLALPGTWVVMLHYAGLVGGIVTVSLIGPQLLVLPPYLWGANAGLINVGGLLGCLVGYLYTSLLADSRLKSQAKQQHRGMAEAEDRLPTLFFPLFVATTGFFVFGFCAQYPGPTRWVGLQFGYGMLAFGLTQVPSVGFNYLIDSYAHLAADCFTMVTILRSVIAFAWTFFVATWVEDRGAAEPFGIFGMLMGLFALLTVPLWMFGKRMRIATSAKVERQT
ncbi:major facilitator superfamily domain-containing protein [Parachaetomium inaequale]|uniref:Major facilitator superfamily domain-containing protein n=1 Tax=Parachaetomium inaequale TaxID=2588326 RepID=A0AAN6SP70_9PEZI|nr:major facilitator superfamily domain-containing protein [Parachaetomium inaequale]